MSYKYELVPLDFGSLIGYEGQTELYTCPECGHKLHVTRSLGKLNCFNCSYGRGLRLKDYYSNTVENRQDQYNSYIPEFTKSLFELVTLGAYEKNYLKERGIPNPEVFGIKSTPTNIKSLLIDNFGEDLLIEKGIFYNKDIFPYALHEGRILIPYNGLFQGLVSFKSRSTPYREILKPNTLRYTTLKGSQHAQYLYQPGKLTKNGTLIITEGEFKSIVAYQKGYNCLAIPGISFTYSILKQVKYLSKFFKYIYIILDNDEVFHNNPGPVKAYLRLLQAPNTIPIILPKQKEVKVGLDDFLLTHDEDTFQEILDEGFYKTADTTKYLENLQKKIADEHRFSRNL